MIQAVRREGWCARMGCFKYERVYKKSEGAQVMCCGGKGARNEGPLPARVRYLWVVVVAYEITSTRPYTYVQD